jgi:hypothetical protein
MNSGNFSEMPVIRISQAGVVPLLDNRLYGLLCFGLFWGKKAA